MSKKTVAIFINIMIIFLVIIAILLILNDEKKDRVRNVYEEILKKNIYTFSMEETLDEIKYKVYMTQRGQDISIDMYSDNEHTTTLILDNKSYFIMHDEKEYYDYGDEKIDSDIVTSSLKNIIKKEHTTGKEKINGITYYYEEFENEDMDFVIYSNIDESSYVKTRFYFKGNKLCYIKNIVQNDDENQEELIKTELKYEIDENAFKIPEDYAEAAD